MKVTRIPKYLTNPGNHIVSKDVSYRCRCAGNCRICMLVIQASVWDSQISGLIFRGGNAVRLLGVRAPELEGCPLLRNPCNGEQEKTAD